MISGAHSILYSSNPEADRVFFRDVLGLAHVDAGDGWLIFGLPPAEIAVHPSDKNGPHELYLIADDIQAFVERMKAHGITVGPVMNRGWGLLTEITLPGGGPIGVYEPRHARPGKTRAPAARRAKAAPPRPAAKRPAKKAKARSRRRR